MEEFKDPTNPLLPQNQSYFNNEFWLKTIATIIVFVILHKCGIGQIGYIKIGLEVSWKFIRDSVRLLKRCTKPSRKEFVKVSTATAVGFCIMGFIGFAVKLIHIPINNILVSPN